MGPSFDKAGVLMKRGNLDTDTCSGKIPSEDWSYAARRQGTSRSFETGLEQVLPESLQRAHDPAHTLILDFQPPEMGDNTFLSFKPPSLCDFVTTVLVNSYNHICERKLEMQFGFSCICLVF